ncbi:hypothetical protein [Kaarinaea lacus]
MGKFSILGKSKWAKFGNIIGLLILVAFLLPKTGLINSSTTQGFDYELPAAALNVTSPEQLATSMNGYRINEQGLVNAAKKIGITSDDFKKMVKIDFVFNTNQNGFQGLIIEFKSKLEAAKLKPVYDFIAEDFKQYVLKNREI